MDLNTLIKFEYERKFFGFNSQGFIVNFQDRILETIDDGIKVLVQQLDMKLSPDADDKHHFHKKLAAFAEDLKIKYTSSVKAAISEAKNDISKIFDIPDYILLPEDKALGEFSNKECNVDKLQNEVNSLTTEIKKVRCLKRKKRLELKNADAVLKQADILRPRMKRFKLMNSLNVTEFNALFCGNLALMNKETLSL